MKYMGGSTKCILYTGQALTVPRNGWLLQLSLVHMPHWQNFMNSSHSIPLPLF